uniref:Uncharacterized protein n=1 Tax=viral metagenome TaxID=1070528 RepID=A0A6M3LWS7_9ZZZZ
MTPNDMENTDIELKTDREVLISLAKDVQYIRENIEALQTAQADTCKRVDQLEKWQAWTIAVAGVIGGAVAFIISFFDFNLLKKG